MILNQSLCKSNLVCLLFLLLCFLAISSAVHAQVNTEAMRRLGLEQGWYSKLGLSLDYSSGNTDLLTFKTSFRSDYVRKKSHIFAVANFKLGKQGGKSHTNRGFAHLRGIRALTQTLVIEGFLQKQFNEPVLLDDRELAGGGLRLIVMHPNKDSKSLSLMHLYIGIGAMWEREELDLEQEMDTELFRSTNYATAVFWNVFCVLFLAKRLLPDAWFERAIVELGQSMGVTAALSADLLDRFGYPDVRKFDSQTDFARINQSRWPPFYSFTYSDMKVTKPISSAF